MLDQTKTGKLIASARRDAGLTQRELADRLGVSDKAVSKWETGRGMPDVSVMPELCEALSLSANELLSGERLTGEETIRQKAEENIMELMKDNKKVSAGTRWTLIGGITGILLLILFLIALSGINNNDYIFYLDLPSIACVAGISLIVLTAAGRLKSFFKAFVLCFKRTEPGGLPSEEHSLELRDSEAAVSLAIRSNLLAGVFGFITGVVTMMQRLDDPAAIGPNMAVACLTLFYAVIFDIILLPVGERLKHRAGI